MLWLFEMKHELGVGRLCAQLIEQFALFEGEIAVWEAESDF
jgi:hypothetical protein